VLESTPQTLLSYAWNKFLLRRSGYAAGFGERATPADAPIGERLLTLEATFREIGVVDLARGAALQAQYLREALREHDAERVVHGLAWQAWNAAMTQRTPNEARKILDQMDALAARSSTPYMRATTLSARAGCAIFQRRMGDALEPATEAERLFREQCAGTHWEQNLAAIYRYAAIEQTGGFATILREAPIRAREAADRDDRFGGAVQTLFLSFAHLALDQPEEAQRYLTQERARHAGTYGAFDIWCGIRTAHVLLYCGQYAEAHRHMQDQWARFVTSPMARGQFYRASLQSLLARAAMAALKDDRAVLRTAEQHARTLVSMRQPHAEALGVLHLADVCQRRGDLNGAVRHLEDLAGRGRQLHAPMLGLYAQRALGKLIGGDRGRELVAACDAKLRAEGVLAPEKWARVWIESVSD
jgi:hypothetical protein